MAAALLIRLIWLGFVVARGGVSALSRPDTASYLEPGRNLLLHGWFATGGAAEVVRTPGYAVFLAVWMSLGGAWMAALAQVVLSVLTVLLAGKLAARIFGEGKTATWAIWFAALEPLGVIYSVLLLPETMFTFLLLLSLDRILAFWQRRLLGVVAAGGFLLAAAAFVRPVAYYLPVVLALGLAFGLRATRGMRWKAPAVLLLCSMPWLLAWQARNRAETGFGGFSAIATENLYFYTAAGVMSRVEGDPLARVQDAMGYPGEQRFAMRHPEMAGWSAGQRMAWMRKEAWSILRAHPWPAARLYGEGMMRTALNPGGAVVMSLAGAPVDETTLEWERSEGAARTGWRLLRQAPEKAAVMTALTLAMALLYLLAALGVLRGSAMPLCAGMIAGVAIYFVAVSGGAAGIARLRAPAMPLVCVLAGAGAVRQDEKK